MENQDPIQQQMKRGRLLEQAKEATSSAGVYLMKDHESHILYVGKAKNLKNRLVTYFQPQPHESPRTEMMVYAAHHFDVILTETEAEALILEATLIKKHKPKFNVRLKDDKAYPYIRIQLSDAFPRLEWTRKPRRDEALYFGPFPSAWSARQSLKLLNETFLLRDCSDNTFRHRSRPCILHQIGKCSAPCVAKVSQPEYHEKIQEAVLVLQGKGDRLIRSLEKGMKDASERMEYEEAAHYRDQLQNLKLITETQGVLEAGKERNRDIVGIARKETQAHAALLEVRGGKLIAVNHYHLQNTDPSQTFSEVLYGFLSQYYAANKDEAIPPEVLVMESPADPDIFERALGVSIRVAETKEDGQILNVAKANAEHALELAQKKDIGHGAQAVEEVFKKLQLDRLPQRIECFDISNIQGQDAVASRVVFINGSPDKALYRRYKIKTVEGANDFAMMKEVLGRRFLNKNEDLPDLVIVDGGKGQLAQAVAIFEELSVQGVAVAGLAKARTEQDFESKEVQSSRERIFLPGRKNPIMLNPGSPSFKLLTHLRDEAHRFAITYHRHVRKKRILGS